MTALRAALADDAVLVGHLHLPAALDPGRVRAQLAAIPTPGTRRWVFVRQLTIRTNPASLGIAVRDALERLAQTAQQDRAEFDDFATLAAALGRDLRDGTVGHRWFWRALELPAAPAAALAAFLRADPLRTWEALIAWQQAALLPTLWPLLTETDAAALTADLARATGSPPWPDPQREHPVQPDPNPPSLIPFPPAAAFWHDALPPSRPALRQLAVLLSLLRWQPAALAHPAARAYAIPSMHAALRKAATAPPVRTAEPGPPSRHPTPARPSTPLPPQRTASPQQPDPPLIQAAPPPSTAFPNTGAEPIRTAFGGVLFLLNALDRIGIRRRLAEWPGPHPPSGFALLHDLATRSAVPPNEPLLLFLAAQSDPMTNQDAAQPALLDALQAELLALFPPQPEDPPGLPFLQQDATLVPAPLHLDLYLNATATDLRVRRAALDRDPGWVPWLGRVVHFHYPAIPTRWARPR